jgi:hypothetical protein
MCKRALTQHCEPLEGKGLHFGDRQETISDFATRKIPRKCLWKIIFR